MQHEYSVVGLRPDPVKTGNSYHMIQHHNYIYILLYYIYIYYIYNYNYNYIYIYLINNQLPSLLNT